MTIKLKYTEAKGVKFLNPGFMVTGQTTFDEKTFLDYYIPAINTAIQQKFNVYVGMADGVDKLTRRYLAEKKYDKVIIVNKKDDFNPVIFGLGWTFVHGFSGYPERDDWMLEKCDHVVGFIKKAGNELKDVYSLGSGTFRNLMIKKFGNIGKEIQTLIRESNFKTINDVSIAVKKKFNIEISDFIKSRLI